MSTIRQLRPQPEPVGFAHESERQVAGLLD
ncbi:uncharacterized protein METZ01_LOCUS203633, partial [marine metagenome]